MRLVYYVRRTKTKIYTTLYPSIVRNVSRVQSVCITLIEPRPHNLESLLTRNPHKTI